MKKTLTTQNAQITTATVEVKTLTISGKQVTLSVFRQLREEPLIAYDGALNGVPWGYVNYHPDKCGNSDHHLHVVWQKGTDLCRSQVNEPRWPGRRFFGEWADGFIQSIYCVGGHKLPEWARRWDTCVEFSVEGLPCRTANEPVNHWRPDQACKSQADAESAQKAFLCEVTAETERRRRITAHWEALNALPQLFIAV